MELDEIPGLVLLILELLDPAELLDIVEVLDNLEEELLEFPNSSGIYIAISLLHGLYFIDIDHPFSFLNITHYIYGLVI